MKTSLVLRLVLATALVLGAMHLGSREAARVLLPLLRAALVVVAEDFRIERFELTNDRANASIGALAVLDRPLFLGGRAIVPDGTQAAVVGTTIGTVMQPVMVALVLVLAWPARSAEFLLRLLSTGPLVLLVLLADTPFSLAAWLWDGQIKAYEPGRSSLLVAWNVFLNGGGRLALGLIAGTLAIVLAQQAAARWRRPA